MAGMKLPGISGRKVTVQTGTNVKIHHTAKFGPGVVIGNNVRVGAGCHIGANSRIDDTTILAHVTLGERSVINNSRLERCVIIGRQARCSDTFIERGANIGERFTIYGRGLEQTIVSHAVIGDNVDINGAFKIGGYNAAERVVIGNDTRIYGSPDEQTAITHVEIGKNCWIDNSKIDRAVFIDDRVRLERVIIDSYVRIRSDTDIQDAEIGRDAEIGKRVIIRPHVAIPAYWLIPDDTIVNPNPNSHMPVVIARTAK